MSQRIPLAPAARRRSRVWWIGLSAPLALMAASCGSGEAPPPTQGSEEPIISASPSPTLKAEAVEVPARPGAMEYGLGAAWVSVDVSLSEENPRIVKIDGRSKKVTLTIRGGGHAAVGPDAVWVVGEKQFMGRSTLKKVDTKTGKTLLGVALEAPYDVDVGPQAVWATVVGGLARVNPTTGEVRKIHFPEGQDSPYHVLATDDAVWVSDPNAGYVTRVDPNTNRVKGQVVVSGARELAVADGDVWVASQDGQVQRIDPRTVKVVATISQEGVGAGHAITACDGSIWTSNSNTGIYRIDPATNKVELVLPLANDYLLGIACGERELWATSSNDTAAYYHRLT